MILREIFSRWMIASFLAVLTLPFWAPAMIYLCLRSLLVAPNGAIIWAFIGAVGAYSLWAWATWLALAVTTAKTRRSLRIAGEAGDEAAAAQYYAAKLTPLPVWRHATAFIGIQLLIPPSAALAMWQGMVETPDLSKINGQIRPIQPRQVLEHTLRQLEARGLFTPFN
jgi:hypothetical protein